MQDYSMPAIEGLLRQMMLDDTAISLDTILLDNNPATAIRPPGLRSYQTGLTPSAVTPGYVNFVADYKALYGSLIAIDQRQRAFADDDRQPGAGVEPFVDPTTERGSAVVSVPRDGGRRQSLGRRI